MGETVKTGKCGITSRGRNSKNWKMQEHMPWAKQQKLENAGAHVVGETAKTGKCGSTYRWRLDYRQRRGEYSATIVNCTTAQTVSPYTP